MMKVPAASSTTRKTYDAIALALESRGAEGGVMFGMPSLKIGGKGFAGLFGDALVFKLGGDAHAMALALRGATLFDPSGMGRAMKEWVVVPKVHAKKWAGFADEALIHVSSSAKLSTKKAASAKQKRAPGRVRIEQEARGHARAVK